MFNVATDTITAKPYKIFISMNLLQMPFVITWDEKNEAIFLNTVLNVKKIGSG